MSPDGRRPSSTRLVPLNPSASTPGRACVKRPPRRFIETDRAGLVGLTDSRVAPSGVRPARVQRLARHFTGGVVAAEAGRDAVLLGRPTGRGIDRGYGEEERNDRTRRAPAGVLRGPTRTDSRHDPLLPGGFIKEPLRRASSSFTESPAPTFRGVSHRAIGRGGSIGEQRRAQHSRNQSKDQRASHQQMDRCIDTERDRERGRRITMSRTPVESSALPLMQTARRVRPLDENAASRYLPAASRASGRRGKVHGIDGRRREEPAKSGRLSRER